MERWKGENQESRSLPSSLPFFAELGSAALLLLLEKRPENNKMYAGCDL